MNTNQRLHVGIIPDGNRRWARKRSLVPWRGHEQAVQTCRELFNWVREDGRIGVLTLWAFSTENWNRSEEEISELMKIYEQFLQEERPVFVQNRTRFVYSGRLDRVPASLAALIEDLVSETASFEEHTLNFALDYGGRDEIVRAVRKLPDTQNVNEGNVRDYLDHPELPDFDLVIRTSGEQRLSGFFIWQAAYAEYYFTEKLFPDFEPQDLATALTEFERRQRRFGS